MSEKKIFTKGDVLVNEIKIGDIQFEFEYGLCFISRVKTMPVESQKNPGLWEWVNENVFTGEEINYAVTEGLSHYGPNLYKCVS